MNGHTGVRTHSLPLTGLAQDHLPHGDKGQGEQSSRKAQEETSAGPTPIVEAAPIEIRPTHTVNPH